MLLSYRDRGVFIPDSRAAAEIELRVPSPWKLRDACAFGARESRLVLLLSRFEWWAEGIGGAAVLREHAGCGR